jgi:hypothetical protein
MKYVIGVIFILVYMLADRPQTQLGDIALSHEEAMYMCEDLNLTYNYEAEGYTTAEFCE